MKIQIGKEEEYQRYRDMNSKDEYSKGVLNFTDRWVDLMEKGLSEGLLLENIAKDYAHKADTEGITGFMYGCAAQALSYFWEHGEVFRRWYNLSVQIRNEGERANETGEVLNPAIINIDIPENR